MIPWVTPEEEELARKLADLNALETDLADQETVLATLLIEMYRFQRAYLRVVGRRYAELDELEARVAEALAELAPGDKAAREEAQRTRQRAEESAESVGEPVPPDAKEGETPSEQLRKIYREVAKKVHPDLGTDIDRAERVRVMTEANQAYESGDEARLAAILRDWEARPEAITGAGTADELIRAIRKVALVTTRLKAIASEIAEIEASDFYQLKIKAEHGMVEGRDILEELAATLDENIASTRSRLEMLDTLVGAQ